MLTTPAAKWPRGSEVCPGGEETIKKIFERTPIQLPADYYEFLSCISGTGNIGSIEFEIESDDEDIGNIPICLWSANRALSMQNEFAHSMKENFISKVWFIGDMATMDLAYILWMQAA